MILSKGMGLQQDLSLGLSVGLTPPTPAPAPDILPLQAVHTDCTTVCEGASISQSFFSSARDVERKYYRLHFAGEEILAYEG